MKPYRIIIADDHALFRQGLKRILEDISRDRGHRGSEGRLELLKVLHGSGRTDGRPGHLDAEPERTRSDSRDQSGKIPVSKCWMLTMHKDRAYFYQAISEGADGIFSRKMLMPSFTRPSKKSGKTKSTSLRSSPTPLPRNWRIGASRTLRRWGRGRVDGSRKEILKLIAEGRSNKEIGDLSSSSVPGPWSVTGQYHGYVETQRHAGRTGQIRDPRRVRLKS